MIATKGINLEGGVQESREQVPSFLETQSLWHICV